MAGRRDEVDSLTDLEVAAEIEGRDESGAESHPGLRDVEVDGQREHRRVHRVDGIDERIEILRAQRVDAAPVEHLELGRAPVFELHARCDPIIEAHALMILDALDQDGGSPREQPLALGPERVGLSRMQVAHVGAHDETGLRLEVGTHLAVVDVRAVVTPVAIEL